MLHKDKNQAHLGSITINYKPFGKVNNGAVVSLSFNNWNIFSHDSDYSKLDFFWVKATNDGAIDEIPQKNL